MTLKATEKTKHKPVPKKPDAAKLKKELAAKAKQEAADAKKAKIVKAPVELLPVLTEEQKQAKAAEDDKRFRELEISARTSYTEMMFILREIKAYDLHKYITNAKTGKSFTSFDTWLKDAAPLSRASGYAALKAADKLIPIIPKKELEQMPRHSIELLAKIPKLHLQNPVTREKLTTAAKTQSKKDFTDTAAKTVPDAHIEQKKKIVVDVSAAQVIGDALEAACLLGEVAEDEAIEFICADWLDSECQNEDYAGMTNRSAWQAAKQRKAAPAAAEDLKTA